MPTQLVLVAWCVVWGVLLGRSLVRFMRLLRRHLELVRGKS
jgi:hypothetical protein